MPNRSKRRKLHLDLACGHRLHLNASGPEIAAARIGRTAVCAECEAPRAITRVYVEGSAKHGGEQPPVWISITNDDGVLFERIDASEYDLSRPFAREALVNAIATGVALAMEDHAEHSPSTDKAP